MIIKKYVPGGFGVTAHWASQSVKTTAADIFTDTTFATSIFDASNKVKPEYLPDSVFDSLIVAGSKGSDISIGQLGYEAFTAAASADRSYVGYYWVASNSIELSATTVYNDGTNHWKGQALPSEEGSETLTSGTVTVETGDWFLVESIDLTKAGTSADPYIVNIAIVNNTYDLATDSAAGIVKLGSSTAQTVAANAVTTQSGRTYAVQTNGSNQLVVNIPWTDDNTTYSAGAGLDLNGTTFSHEDTSSVSSISDQGLTTNEYISGVALAFDTYGHTIGASVSTSSINFNVSDNYAFKSFTDGTNTAEADSNTDLFTFTAGTIDSTAGVTVVVNSAADSLTIGHANTSNQASTSNSGRTYIQNITLDTYGHITNLTTATETVIDNDHIYDIDASAVTGGAGLNLNASGSGSGTDTVNFKGAGATTVTRVDADNIQISSVNTTYSAADGLTLTGTTFSQSFPVYWDGTTLPTTDPTTGNAPISGSIGFEG